MAIDKNPPPLPEGSHPDPLKGGTWKPLGGLPTEQDTSTDMPAPNIHK